MNEIWIPIQAKKNWNAKIRNNKLLHASQRLFGHKTDSDSEPDATCRKTSTKLRTNE